MVSSRKFRKDTSIQSHQHDCLKQDKGHAVMGGSSKSLKPRQQIIYNRGMQARTKYFSLRKIPPID